MSPIEELFRSGLGRGPRMQINALSGSPQGNKTERPAEPPGYNGHRQHGHQLPRSQLQRRYDAAMNDHQAGSPVYHQHMNDPRKPTPRMEQVVWYPDARQKKLAIRMFDGAELYEGLGCGFWSGGVVSKDK